jgi:hypothetical protein
MFWEQFFVIFYQFSAKNGVFLKHQSYDQIFAKTSSILSKKRKMFAKFLGENIFKIVSIGPRSKTFVR